MRVTIGVILVVIFAAPAFGQAEYYRGEPVDQTVSDLDPLQTSLRRMDPGLAQYNQRVTLYRPAEALTWQNFAEPDVDRTTGLVRPGNYRMETPAYRAWVNRPDYVVFSSVEDGGLAVNKAPAVDGLFAVVGGSNIVFDLIPQSAPPPLPDPLPEYDARIDGRLNLQVNGQIDGRVDAQQRNDYLSWPTAQPTPDHDPLRDSLYPPSRRPDSDELIYHNRRVPGPTGPQPQRAQNAEASDTPQPADQPD